MNAWNISCACELMLDIYNHPWLTVYSTTVRFDKICVKMKETKNEIICSFNSLMHIDFIMQQKQLPTHFKK